MRRPDGSPAFYTTTSDVMGRVRRQCRQLMVGVLVGWQRHNAVYALTVRRANRVEMQSKMESS
jgi:hypothetical protein